MPAKKTARPVPIQQGGRCSVFAPVQEGWFKYDENSEEKPGERREQTAQSLLPKACEALIQTAGGLLRP